MSKEAFERVAEYLRQFDRLRDTGGIVHQVATDPEAPEGVALMSADLHALLEAAQAPSLEVEILGYAVVIDTASETSVQSTYSVDDLELAESQALRWTMDAQGSGVDITYRTAIITNSLKPA